MESGRAPHVPDYDSSLREEGRSRGCDALQGAVAARADGLAGRWLEELDRYLSIPRPQILPDAGGNQPPASMAPLLAWIACGNGGGHQIPEEVLDLVEELVDLREGQGRFLGDLYREFYILDRILFGALREEAAREPPVPPGDVAEAAGALSRRLLTAVGVATDLFDRRRQRLGQSGRRMERFASNVRHELRNPIGAAQAGVQLLLEDGDDLAADRYQKVLTSVEQSVIRAGEILDTVTRLEEDGAGRSVESWTPLRDVLEQAADAARRGARGEARVEVAEPVPEVMVDGPRMELLVHNLMENGVKYRHPERTAKVVVRARREGADGSLLLEVEDNGLGIAEEDQERIFHRFYRAHPGEAEGTGLGLSIAREAVRQIGGELAVESEPGQGSTFTVSLPPDWTRPGGSAGAAAEA